MSNLTLILSEKTSKSNTLDESPKMGKFASYLKEREGVNLIETDKGFAIYSITGEECYIRDIWVSEEHRKAGVASAIADQVVIKAKEAGCKLLTGSVCPAANGSTASLKVLLGYGMKLHSSAPNLIIFTKDIV